MSTPRLTDEQLQQAIDTYERFASQPAAAAHLDLPRTTFKDRLERARAKGFKPTTKREEKDESAGIDRGAVDLLHKSLRSAKGIRRYVITAAQNATPVNEPFLASLLGYCKHNKAQLIVIPYRYKNPTSMWSKAAEHDDWWAPELTPYLYDQRIKLNKHLMLLGDIKAQPTAVSPLQGFESISGPQSAILGHPKLELTTVPTPQAKLPKILTTTGAVTEKNYTPTKAGKKGEFHHTFGACVVEIDGSAFHLRQLNAMKDGTFMDLNWEYLGRDRRDTGGIAALVMGDSHVEFIDPQVVKATFGEGGIVPRLKPEYLVWHDVHDFYSRNHHHIGEPFIDYVKHLTGTDDVRRMLVRTFAFVDTHTPKGAKNIFVPSNHPDALAKWVKRADWKSDPTNAEFLLETTLEMLRGSKMGPTGAKTIDPFVLWGKRMLNTVDQAVFLKHEESFQLHGIELGYHGHYGLNGARGSRKSFAKIGTKVVIGHGHSPGIYEGAYQTGINARLDLGYLHGPSSWLHTDCVVYKNGKRSLVSIINGKWRA